MKNIYLAAMAIFALSACSTGNHNHDSEAWPDKTHSHCDAEGHDHCGDNEHHDCEGCHNQEKFKVTAADTAGCTHSQACHQDDCNGHECEHGHNHNH